MQQSRKRNPRAQLGLIWGLAGGVIALQLVLWASAGSLDAGVITIWLVAGWIVTVVLAVLASRAINALSHRLAERESAHRATLGGRECEVQFLGLAPGFVGLAQANIRVPAGLAAGDNTLVITVNGVDSNPARVAVF